jgi:DNA-3-methyladenine glycosylase I
MSESLPAPPPEGLHADERGVQGCRWATSTPLYTRYHDEEWGRPELDDARLFEKVCLEGFQSGLSWLTILKKREAFRAAFGGFDLDAVAAMGDADVARLLGDAGIVRHRGKIEATLNNARQAQRLRDEAGSLAAYFWRWEPPRRSERLGWAELRALGPCAEATAMSKDLKRRGWRFVGPTTAYAFMQAMGLVNDHVRGCAAGDGADLLRSRLVLPA